MIKISKRTETRKITVEEFIRQKSVQPYKDMRQIAKSLNFLLIFGGSAGVFSENALETSWTPEQVDNFIKENNCQDEVEAARLKYAKAGYDDEKIKYIAVATRMRDNFFKGYPGLMERIERERKFAASHGYIRSPFGATRKTIELMLRGDYDNKNLSGFMRNLENIAANTAIQNDEASVARRAMVDIQKWLEQHNMKSRMFNEIHDSIDFYIYYNEIVPVLWIARKILEAAQPEFASSPVKLVVDCEISSIPAGQYYKGGVDPNVYLPEGVTWDDLSNMTEEEALSWIDKTVLTPADFKEKM